MCTHGGKEVSGKLDSIVSACAPRRDQRALGAVVTEFLDLFFYKGQWCVI